MAVTVTLRFFAAAKAATGLDEVLGTFEHEPTIGELVAGIAPGPASDADELQAILRRCSFLVDGVSTRDRALVVPSGSVVDVMPPFAGG